MKKLIEQYEIELKKIIDKRNKLLQIDVKELKGDERLDRNRKLVMLEEEIEDMAFSISEMKKYL